MTHFNSKSKKDLGVPQSTIIKLGRAAVAWRLAQIKLREKVATLEPGILSAMIANGSSIPEATACNDARDSFLKLLDQAAPTPEHLSPFFDGQTSPPDSPPHLPG